MKRRAENAILRTVRSAADARLTRGGRKTDPFSGRAPSCPTGLFFRACVRKRWRHAPPLPWRNSTGGAETRTARPAFAVAKQHRGRKETRAARPRPLPWQNSAGCARKRERRALPLPWRNSAGGTRKRGRHAPPLPWRNSAGCARKRNAPTPFLRPRGDSERLFCRGKDTDGTKKQGENGCFFKNAPLFFQKPLIFGKTML